MKNARICKLSHNGDSMTKKELFLSLVKPNKNGVLRWVKMSEFVGKYESLKLGNGGSWCRASSNLAKEYVIEFDKSQSSGNSIDAIKLNGFNTRANFNQNIRADIKDFYKNKKCVMLGVCGTSENTKIEIDHKDGRKNDERVADLKAQKLDDFQPLCKAANDAKRQICKACKKSDKRWSAKNILGNPYDFYAGDERYTKNLGCVGCYQYDPVAYRKITTQKIIKEASKNTLEFMMKKLYGEK